MLKTQQPNQGFARPFWLFVSGQCFGAAADNVMSVAIAAFTYSLTGSAWAYAMQMVIGILPSILLSGIAGRAVDQLDRRRVLIFSAIANASLILLYPLCRVPMAIYALNLARSSAAAFAVPARIALMPELAGKDRALQANGVRTALIGAVNLIGPLLAGVLIGRAGTTVGFVTASASVLGAAAIWSALPGIATVDRPPQAAVAGSAGRPKPKPSLYAARQALADPVLASIVILFSVYSIGGTGTNAIYYPFVSSVLRAGPWFFGAALSLYYGANLVGGLIIARLGRTRLPYVAMMLVSTVLWGCISVFRATIPLLAISFFDGVLYCFITAFYETSIQVRTPRALVGQTAAFARALSSGAQISGILVCGRLAQQLGPALAYRWAFLGSLALTVTAAFVLRNVHGRETTAAVEG